MRTYRGTLNSVELMGWLGGDPEMRFTPSGVAICKMRVATKRLGPQDASGKREAETDWTNVDVWDRLAELCNSNLHKGSRVMVVGSLRTDSWNDKETNTPRYRTYVRADSIIFLDARPEQVAEIPQEEAESGEEVPF